MKEMKYGVSGTGDVGHVIASKLIDLGHEVMMGARSASSEKAQKWAEEHGSHAYYGTFEDAAKLIVENAMKYYEEGDESVLPRSIATRHWNWQGKITSMEKF